MCRWRRPGEMGDRGRPRRSGDLAEPALSSTLPLIYVDALGLSVRDEGLVSKKSLYMAIAVDDEGRLEVLRLWLQRTEGANFWLSVVTEFRNRGVEDVLWLCADGLTGMPEAVEAAGAQLSREAPRGWPG